MLTGSQPTAESSLVEDKVQEKQEPEDVSILAQEKLKLSNLIERIFLITLDRGKLPFGIYLNYTLIC